MNNDIKEILEYLSDFNRERPFVLSIYDRKILSDYITNLQEENKEYKRLMSNVDINSVDYVYDKDTKLYTFDRKNYYKINKRLNERLDYKSRCEKAIKYIKNNTYKAYETDYMDLTGIKELLDILQGSDEE